MSLTELNAVLPDDLAAKVPIRPTVCRSATPLPLTTVPPAQIFNAFDTNSDKALTWAEWKHALYKLPKPLLEKTLSEFGCRRQPLDAAEQMQAARIAVMLDQNRDGTLSAEELQRLFDNDPHLLPDPGQVTL